MTITIAQLLASVTEAEQLAEILTQAQSLGFKLTSWGSSSWQRLLLQLLARLKVTELTTVQTIVGGIFNATAEGDWLTKLSEDHFGNTRAAAVRTVGTLRLTCAASAGPYTINASDVVVAWQDDATITYRNTTGGALASGSTLDVTIVAESAGADWNVPASEITVMVTPYAGVTCSNPIPGGASDWITTAGADEETDGTLRERNRTKWATLSGFTTEAAYINYALAASGTVTRATVDKSNPRGSGTIDLYVAGSAGSVSGAVVTAVDEYISGVTDGIVRRGMTHDLAVYSATNYSLAITGTITHSASLTGTAARTAAEAAITTYLQGVPVGGSNRTDGVDGKVLLGQLWAAVAAVPGIVNVVLTAPAADTTLTIGQVAVPDFSTPLTTVSL